MRVEKASKLRMKRLSITKGNINYLTIQILEQEKHKVLFFVYFTGNRK